MVPQETVIFAASARDNLRYGNWTATDAELWEAARAANAEEFLRKLPQGLDTFMGAGGARLSGGLRQRIAIAQIGRASGRERVCPYESISAVAVSLKTPLININIPTSTKTRSSVR